MFDFGIRVMICSHSTGDTLRMSPADAICMSSVNLLNNKTFTYISNPRKAQPIAPNPLINRTYMGMINFIYSSSPSHLPSPSYLPPSFSPSFSFSSSIFSFSPSSFFFSSSFSFPPSVVISYNNLNNTSPWHLGSLILL